jgi:hypothetical protein
MLRLLLLLLLRPRCSSPEPGISVKKGFFLWFSFASLTSISCSVSPSRGTFTFLGLPPLYLGGAGDFSGDTDDLMDISSGSVSPSSLAEDSEMLPRPAARWLCRIMSVSSSFSIICLAAGRSSM